jgi:hypothetical protein
MEVIDEVGSSYIHGFLVKLLKFYSRYQLFDLLTLHKST